MKESMHKQFYHLLLRKIKSGELKNGEKLPPERSLCEIYKISRTTVREALRQLESEGYLVRKQGSGSFVNIRSLKPSLQKLYTLREEFADQGIKHNVRILKFEIIAANEDVSEKLSIDRGDDVIRIVRVFSAADVPYTIEYTHVPKAVFPKMSKEIIRMNGLYNTFKSFSHKPTSAVETIKAVNVNKYQRKILELPDDILAIRIERIAKSDNLIVEYTENIIRNDYFLYTVSLS